MLDILHIENIAVAKNVDIEFGNGFNVLTGETGAGKSLIIDTILLLLGSRADSDMIRYGTKSASIEGVFSYCNEEIDTLLDKFGIPKNEFITIYREIYESQKKVASFITASSASIPCSSK